MTSGSWVEVFNLGTKPGTSVVRTTTTMEVYGSAVYVGGCGDCGASGNDTGFQNVVATNVNGALPPMAETGNGWHFAAANGLPNRYITSFAVSPADPKIVYATLSGYLSNLRPPGSFMDPNTNIGEGNVYKSTDAGENWVNVSGNLPAVEANTVLIKGNQLIVATDVGPFISADLDGSDWTVLGSGLPRVPVNMVRMKPKATETEPDTLMAATFGRSIWSYTFANPAAGGGNNAPFAVISASPNKGLPPLTVSLVGVNSTDPDGDAQIVRWEFNPGDGSPVIDGTASTISHVYKESGTYNPTLRVFDSSGAVSVAAASTTVTVDTPAVVTPVPTNVPGTQTTTGKREGRFGGGAWGLLGLLPLVLVAARRRRVA